MVTAVGTRDEVLALADDQTRVIDIGSNVAYPGFVDAHSHWIGDRAQYLGESSAQDAMKAAVSRGWTSIAELWEDEWRIGELQDLADRRRAHPAGRRLPGPQPPRPHRRAPRELVHALRTRPGHRSAPPAGREDHPRQRLGQPVLVASGGPHRDGGRCDEAGWQVAIHTVSTEAHEMVLAAYEHVLAGGPNTRHHRIEHAVQVTDEQLARMVALDVATVIHLDGASSDWVLEADYLGNLGENTAWLARWRDFVDAGLHVASAVDTPWIFPG